MRQNTAQGTMRASTGPISAGTEGLDAALEDELNEAQLEQISGGWSGTPLQLPEDVEAY